MRALILGGNGFIGSHLTDALLARGHAVRSYDKYAELYREPLTGVEYLVGDFGNRGLLADALHGVDVVFHLVSTTVPKTSNDDPAFDVQSNVIDTLGLLDLCVARKIARVVYISSGGTVYGEPASLPIREDSQTTPLCSYGITKLCVEKYLELYRRLHGLDYVILRPSNPYGPRQNPGSIQGAISVFLGNVATGQPIRIWGDGSVVRDYLYIQDLAEGICRAAETGARHRLFNLGSGSGVSLRQIVEVVDAVTGRKSNVEFLPRRQFDVPEIYLDVTRAAEELDWRPTVGLRDGVARTWDFVRELLAG